MAFIQKNEEFRAEIQQKASEIEDKRYVLCRHFLCIFRLLPLVQPWTSRCRIIKFRRSFIQMAYSRNYPDDICRVQEEDTYAA